MAISCSKPGSKRAASCLLNGGDDDEGRNTGDGFLCWDDLPDLDCDGSLDETEETTANTEENASKWSKYTGRINDIFMELYNSDITAEVKVDRLIEVVVFMNKQNSDFQKDTDKRFRKLQKARNRLLHRVNLSKIALRANEGRIASLEAKLRGRGTLNEESGQLLQEMVRQMEQMNLTIENTELDLLDLSVGAKEN